MTCQWFTLGFTLVYVLVSSVRPATAATPTESLAEVREILAQCQAAYHRLVDYRGTLRREVGEKRPLPSLDVIDVTFRKPSFLYLRWQAGAYKGTELLARPSWNRGNLLIRLGEWFEYVTASVPQTEASEPFIPGLKDVSEWLTALMSLAQRPISDRSLRQVEIRTAGPTLGEGRVLLSVPAYLIPFRDNTVASYEFLIERGTGVPFELVLRGAAGDVHQRLTYTDLQVNVGVPFQAFHWEERADGFRTLPRGEADIDLREFIQNWQRRYGEIADYTGVWVTDEVWGGRRAHSQAVFKFRKPFDLYLNWSADGRGRREALFRQGWNKGRVRVRTALWGLPLIGDLAPDGYLARQGSHAPLTEFGLNRLVERLQEQLLRAWLQEELEARFLGVEGYEGHLCYALEFVFPTSRRREYSHLRVVTFWNIAQRIPVKYEAYDWTGELDERHEFRQLQLNTSLNDVDFDAANPAYGFLLFRRAPHLDRFLTGRE
jgi:hypothetical protein